ncbi:MAG: dUTP diphosphatase [Candidatus Nanopelagicaceae bacterium]
MKLAIRLLDPEMPLPEYAHPGDAGFDLRSTIDCTIAPGERKIVPTGISVAIPDGYVGLVHPRSGLAAKHGISMVNTPGTIDAGYRGELQVILINHDLVEPFSISRFDRIAQLVIQKVERVDFEVLDELPSTPRGSDGFGSSGVR